MVDRVFNDQWTILIVITALLLGIAEIGYRFRLCVCIKRRTKLAGARLAVCRERAGIARVAPRFHFAMAVGRYETRRDLVLKEANAVGTTWLRADCCRRRIARP
jgi:hypothetical protein